MMTELDRFMSVVRFERPDYVPLMNTPGLGYVHHGGLKKLHDEGMPETVNDFKSWVDYWGQGRFEYTFSIGTGTPGIKQETWTEDGFEYIRYETGALTRQVIANDTTYSMPDFMEFHVRDRASWELFRELSTPTGKRSVEDEADRMDNRTHPGGTSMLSTWGRVRNYMGPERALTAIYDDPALVQEIIDWHTWLFDEFTVPLIERYRPEVITGWEDFAYNHGMLISPAAFRKFCAPHYRHVAEVGRDCGAELFIVDCDGKVDEYCLLLEEVGFNACWPMEQVCGNDLPAYRERQPNFIFAGGIEKEICNTGNGARIRDEIIPKVPKMLEQGGYFPMFDHALQTLVGFEELCRAMTLLHDICGSPESLGDFPRIRD